MLFSRPQFLAWAVRKLSPGKNATPSPPPVFANDKSKSVVRTLEFASQGKADDNLISWADRVKGKNAVSRQSPPLKPVQVIYTEKHAGCTCTYFLNFWCDFRLGYI